MICEEAKKEEIPLINEVVILNLPRCVDRKDHCIRQLIERGTPPNKIQVWKAKDDMDYEKTHHVCEAAIADGFPHFGDFLERGLQNRHPIAIVAQAWNYLRVFREYSQNDKTIVFLHDDWYFKKPYDFEYVAGIVRYGMNLDDNLKCISLWFNRQHDMVVNGIPSEKLVLPEKLLARGFVSKCHDVAMVLTPSGAETIMNLWINQFLLPLESFFSSLTVTSMPGFYTSVKHLVRGSGFPSTIFHKDAQGPIRKAETTADYS